MLLNMSELLKIPSSMISYFTIMSFILFSFIANYMADRRDHHMFFFLIMNILTKKIK